MFAPSLSHAIAIRDWTRWSLLIAASGVLSVSPVLADDRKNVAPLSVVVIDYAGVPAPVMRDALVAGGRIFLAAGVHVTWTTRSVADLERAAANPTPRPAEPIGTIYVQLLSAEMSAKHNTPITVLGQALPGSPIAWVMTPRVENTAQDTDQDFATLLGHVIAHEVGHLLLPRGSHTPTGLMAAAMDMREMSRRGLRFDADQSSLIRARLMSGASVATLASSAPVR